MCRVKLLAGYLLARLLSRSSPSVQSGILHHADDVPISVRLFFCLILYNNNQTVDLHRNVSFSTSTVSPPRPFLPMNIIKSARK